MLSLLLVTACGKSKQVLCVAKGPCYAATSRDGGTSCTQTQLPDGSACEDGSICTVAETCSQGVCGGGSKTACTVSSSLAAGSAIELNGCSYGGYYASVTLGDTQKLNLLPDSGSMTTVVASSLCSNCSGVSPL
ncbi:MAG: hypothetical protein EOO40_12385, partial [Deltaproteobacteria bacterium]